MCIYIYYWDILYTYYTRIIHVYMSPDSGSLGPPPNGMVPQAHPLGNTGHGTIYTYIHTYIPTYLHTYIPTYLHTYIHYITLHDIT